MSIVSQLAAMPGVLVAGEYSYRGDRFSYEGNLDEEMARMASIMCRATSLGTHMQVDIMSMFSRQCGCTPVRGWTVRGARYSVCVVTNVFCFIDNQASSLNEVLAFMVENLDADSARLV